MSPATLLDRTLASLAGAATLALLGVVMAGVVSRGLNAPFVWTDELSGYLMVWLAALGWMIATRRGSHIRIRVLQDRLPPPMRQGLERLIQLALALLGAVIAWHSVHLIRVNADVEAVTLPIPTALLYAPLLPAGLLTMAQALAELVRPRGPDGLAEEAVL